MTQLSKLYFCLILVVLLLSLTLLPAYAAQLTTKLPSQKYAVETANGSDESSVKLVWTRKDNGNPAV